MFPITYAGQEWGRAKIEKQGLYCRILCKCDPPTAFPFRIQLQTGGKIINLGTCIKTGNFYIVDTKVPGKYIQEGDMNFYIHTKQPIIQESIIPVREDGPFPYLCNLHKARMVKRNGQVGVIFTE